MTSKTKQVVVKTAPSDVVEKEVYHIDNEADRSALLSLLDDRYYIGRDVFSIDAYVKTGKSKVVFNDDIIVEDSYGNLCVIQDRRIYYLDYDSLLDLTRVLPRDMKSHINDAINAFVGVVLPKPIKGLDCALGIIVNGDEDSNGLVEGMNLDKPVISFNCLDRFYGDDDEVGDLLIRGVCQIVDFTPGESRAMTKKEVTAFNAYEEYERNLKAGKKIKKVVLPPKPPERGFVKVGLTWHRTSTVLLYDQEKKFSILMGVDDDSYFGCQLVDNPKTVADAYTSLVPSVIRDEPQLIRQGEWFFVKVLEQDVPPVEECIALFDRIVMPVESVEANPHWLTTADYLTTDMRDDVPPPVSGRVGPDGTIYALQPAMYHSQHDTMGNLDGWYRFYRNMAFRSFSEKGVD